MSRTAAIFYAEYVHSQGYTRGANFLIDHALSPRVAAGLRTAGHNAVHVLDYGMHAAPDEAVWERAALESRVVVSADIDFGTMLALRETTSPSVILFRAASLRRADDQVALILAALPSTEGGPSAWRDRDSRAPSPSPSRLPITRQREENG